GKPDLNLVQLKSWKPSKCVTVNGVDYASGITAKPEINIDLDNDGIPDINIDNKGDFKPHINISKDGKTPHINIADIHEWNPNRDYKTGNFTYDSMDDKITPQLNIDTDGDGYPDLNLDLDNDGIPDLNIDTDGDFIPDLNIDGDGDGKPDINVDRDDDGIADENIKEISEWKPEHNVDGPFGYDTMNFNEEDPDAPDKEPNGEVQGSYYPGANVGGALTGDTSDVWYLFSQCLFSLALISWLIFKHSIAHRQ
ncbi:MAG: hypothetical protein HFE67_02125, partial [Erysipelotrichaceae bacterium]|nr:hypothetical protein [Erysipelotrichaceae bacterium]